MGVADQRIQLHFFFLLEIVDVIYVRWKVSFDPHGAFPCSGISFLVNGKSIFKKEKTGK